jgi:hypothetical protein
MFAETLSPSDEESVELLRSNQSKHVSKSVMRGRAILKIYSFLEPIFARVAKILKLRKCFCSLEHGAQRDEEDVPQRINHTLMTSRIGDDAQLRIK